MIEDIYSVTTNEGRWWVSKEEYSRLKDRLYFEEPSLPDNTFIIIQRLDGGEVIVRVGSIDALERSTLAQREARRENARAYAEEEGE